MSDVKVIKRTVRIERLQTEPLNEDLRRLTISMRTVLMRRYPGEEERRAVSSKIMRELAA